MAASTTFQSTRPVKDATEIRANELEQSKVSIHASREGRDSIETGNAEHDLRFQSTRPVKDAT